MKKKYSFSKVYKNINEIIEKRFNIAIILIIFLMSILIINLFYIQIIKQDTYTKEVKKLSQNYVSGGTAPRGRIYDRNGNILVDNKAVKVIYYKKDTLDVGIYV